MVYSKEKWLCGIGKVILFYCEICNNIYEIKKNAEICEKECSRGN